MNAQSILLHNKLANQKTNNVLHIIIALLTVGLWIPVWMIIALYNSVERRRLAEKITTLEESE